MKKIKVNADLVLVLKDKNDWIRKLPGQLPRENAAQLFLFVDSQDNCLTVGADFKAAEELHLFPVLVYRIQRPSEILKQKDKALKVIAQAYKDGESITAITNRFQVSPNVIYKAIEHCNIPKRAPQRNITDLIEHR